MTTILCFGDSNTWGCPPFINLALAPNRIPKEQRWAHIMAREAGQNVEVVEDGLSGRTTVFDDPIEGDHKNGSRLIVASIETHAPLDLIVIMLGSNDFKMHFNSSAFTSARGVLTLVQQIKGYYVLAERNPEILIVAPPAITQRAEPEFWGDAWRRCDGHAEYLRQVAERTGCFYFDCNLVARAGEDGVHLDLAGHRALGQALGREARQILALAMTR
ncbi:lysophospholipase L1-like esterase [Pararhizobium capsulatum DSM 1112]|uniref:Lysophospholipase L1-like esterase n=1 Tax=Pararhizobium capsulatum DSM 1112 TaxID=1121113 RepID=A0ABU0BK47_9HYPH|nr:GDSL-type esterase/lipase family protein [Pararhizobium capsulatum]MDQ0318628.1 lysophospholipase L1-like esterase [Pararhizobium capsulatum DSM 1112]